MTLVSRFGLWLAKRETVGLEQMLDQERRGRAQIEAAHASLLRENEMLRQQLSEAISGERFALRFMANIGFHRTFGVKPFPDTVGMPENAPDQPTQQVPSSHVQGIDLKNKAAREFFAKAEERVKEGKFDPHLLATVKESLGYI